MCDMAHLLSPGAALRWSSHWVVFTSMTSFFSNPVDDSIVQYLNSMVGRFPLFDQAMLFICGNAFVQGAAFVSLLWYYWFKPASTSEVQRTREHLLSAMAAGLVAIVLARSLALILPFRVRPRFDPSLQFVLPQGADRGTYWDWSAFPSDHAVMFAALATGLLYVSWRAGLISFLYVGVLILFPRLYLGIHYASDLLAGVALGLVCGVCANVPNLRAQFSAQILRYERFSPGAFYVAMFIATFLFATMFDSVRDAAHSAWRLIAEVTAAHGGGTIASIKGR